MLSVDSGNDGKARMMEDLGSFKGERMMYKTSTDFITEMCRKTAERAIDHFRMFSHDFSGNNVKDRVVPLVKRVLRIETFEQVIERFEYDNEICEFLGIDEGILDEMKIDFAAYGGNSGFRFLGKPLSYAVREAMDNDKLKGEVYAKLENLLNAGLENANPDRQTEYSSD